MRYAYLLFAVSSVATLGVLHKVADHRRCRPAAINLLLFFVAGMLSILLSVHQLGLAVLDIPRVALVVGLCCGICASLGILFFQQSIRLGKISTSWLIIQLSTAIPTLLSILIYHERVGVKRGCSLALATVALLLMWVDRRRDDRQTAASLPKEIAKEATQETV